jgi:hypothetical protein
MITKEEYEAALIKLNEANIIIREFHKQENETVKEKIRNNHIFTDEELNYSAQALCRCSHGLAYPKGCPIDHYWSCSAVLKGISDDKIEHTINLPFMYYDVRGESEQLGTTRKSI